MRSTYNNKKIMAALAAAAMFGVGPAMAASSIFYVDNATKQKIAQPAEFHPLQSCSNQEVSVADGYVVAANQSYVKLADAIKYTCDSEKGQQTSNNKDFEGKSLNYAIVDVNGTTIEVAQGQTSIECPENYRYNEDKTKCEEVEYSYVAGPVKTVDATCSGYGNKWNSDTQNCGKDVQETCADKGGYTNSGKCYATRACPKDYPYERNSKCNSQSSNNIWNKTTNYVYSDEITLKTNWQSSGEAKCSEGYSFISGATSLENACMKATCPQGYEPSGLAGNDACRSLNKLTGRITLERVYKTSVTRYEGCEASVAKSSPLTGDVVKYAEADTAFCELGVDKSFTLIGKTTQYGVTVGISSTVNLKDVSINALSTAAISIDGDVNATIKFTGTNTLVGADNFAGIAKTSKDGKLTIDGTSKVNSLSVNGGYGAAGIGGNVQQEMTSNIEVLAGTISAQGGQYGAAIGGGQNGAASNITIGKETDKYYYNADDALTLSVTGGNDGGAGIGGGSMGGADNIVINNGYITANAPATAAIGAGAGMSCKDIIINNGVLHAVGGTQSSAIGASGVAGTSCEGIVINNGSINAYAGSAASGDTKAIGKKEPVTITGGSIIAVSSNETYDDIMNPKDAQGSPVHRFNIKATEKADDSLFVRSTETGKFSAEAAVAQGVVYKNDGKWDNGKFFPTHHLDVGMNAGGVINQQDQIWAFFGESEEHDLMVSPSVTGDLSKTVASSGKTSRIKWDATQSEFIYNIALLNSFPHDFLVYNGYEQGVKVDSSKIWIMGPDSSAFVTLSKSSSESKTNNYFKLNGDSLTNANVKCRQEEFVPRNVSVTGTTGAPVALYCDPAGYLEGASDTLYTMTAKDKKLYGKAQHVKFMLPYVLNNMEIANSIEPQTNDAKDPIVLADGYDHLVYNGNEQTQVVTSVTLFNKTHYVTDKFDNYVLVADQDYEVLGNKETDASKFDTLKISAKGTNFVGEARRNFVINPFDLANATFTFNPDSLVYNMAKQIQNVEDMYICADAEAAKTPTSCYKLGTNNKDLYEITNTIETDAGAHAAKVAKVCVDGGDFCSNVTNEVTKAFNIAKFPADSLKIAFASADQDTMVYNGEERTQKFEVSLKTLIKKPVKDAAEGEPTFEYVEVSGVSASSTVVTNHAEFDTTGNKATDAGKYTLTITAKDNANFEGFKNYDWKIGARDLAGNVWQRSQRNPENPTSQNNVATICENYQKCVNEADGFTPSADVAKYGCRAVYPCDWGYEKYDPATMTLASTAQTYNAQWQENAVTSVKSKGLDVTYSVMTAKAISDHEADSVYQEKEVPSNRHLNVNGRDPVDPYCVKHVLKNDFKIGQTKYYDKGTECRVFYNQGWYVSDNHWANCNGENDSPIISDDITGCLDIRSNEVSEVEDINVAVEGTGNFKGIQHTAYKMNPYKVENVTINLGDALTFNGETQTQIVKDISIGDNFKVSGTNFTDNFIITDNTGKDAGKNYKLTIIGKKNYKGEQSKEWSIAKFDITSAEITPVFDKELTYNPKSSQQTQKVNSATVKIGDADVDLTFSSSSMTQAFDAGNYNITLIGNGNFTGSKAVTFNVAQFNIETEMVDGEKFVVTMTDKDYQPGTKPDVTIENPILVYNGSEQEQHFAVTAGAIVLNPENYTVTGNKATNVGSQRIVVEGIGNFTGRVECVNPWTIAKQGQVLVTVALKDSNTVYNGQEFTFGGADIIKSATFTKFGEEGEPQTFDIANLVIDPSVIVKGTNAGEYKFDDATLAGIKINGNYEACEEDAGCGVQFNGSATLKIAKAPVTVAVAGKTENVTFDNEEHKFAGYDVTIPEAWTEFLKVEDFTCTECDSVAGKDAGEYALGLAKEKFANANGNFDVTFDVTDGKLVIDPATVQIKLYGNTKEFTFNGERQEVSGFSVPKFIDGNQDFVTLDDIKYTGDTSVSAVDAGIYEMVIDPALFSSANKNFNIEVTEFTNGKLTIKPAPIDVKITGNTDSKYYAARKFTVSGYDVKIEGGIEKAPFSKSDIALVNGAVAEVSAENVKMDGGKVAKYMMGLKKENFASRNQNYDVNFTVVADGYLEIKPVDIVVNIVGNIDSVKYNGKSQSVEGVSITANDPNFGVNDYTYTGATKASAKEGVVELKVDKSKFKLTNDNYIVTSFITKNGYIKVVKTDAIQTAIKSDVKVRAIESGIVVDNANGKAISVFTMNGKTVYSSMRGANTFGSTTISVPKGMYIVKVGSAAQRVNVK